MGFWGEVGAGFLANMFTAVLITAIYVLLQWFLAATDVVFSYNSKFDGALEHAWNFQPAIRVVNRSRDALLLSRQHAIGQISMRDAGVDGRDRDGNPYHESTGAVGNIHTDLSSLRPGHPCRERHFKGN